jgi:hypothetical protein
MTMRINVRTRHNVRIHLRLDVIKSQRKVIVDNNTFYEIELLDGSRLELAECIASLPVEEPKNVKIVTRIKK